MKIKIINLEKFKDEKNEIVHVLKSMQKGRVSHRWLFMILRRQGLTATGPSSSSMKRRRDTVLTRNCKNRSQRSTASCFTFTCHVHTK